MSYFVTIRNHDLTWNWLFKKYFRDMCAVFFMKEEEIEKFNSKIINNLFKKLRSYK